PRPPIRPQGNDMQQGLQIKLTEGAPVNEAAAANPRAAATPLPAERTDALLQRLQPIKVDAGDEQDFALREKSLPPPRTGKTISHPLPPRAPPGVATPLVPGPPEVVRFAPEGDGPVAPQVSVTFSQPMVAVTSHADSIAGGVPVRVTPQPKGRWRWIGTK